MKPNINIDTRTFVRFWLVVIGFILAALAVFYARHALLIIGVALFLALALNVPVTKLAKRLPGKSRVGATAISYVAVVIILGAVLVLVVPPIVEQTAKFLQTAPKVVDGAVKQWHGVESFINHYNLKPQLDNALSAVQHNVSSWAGNFGQALINGVGSLFSFIVSGILVLVLTFLMLVEGPTWLDRLWSLYHNKERIERHRRIVHRMYHVVADYVIGQVIVAVIGAICDSIAVALLHFIFPQVPLSLAIPTAAIVFVFTLIPMFGSTIGAIIITLLLAFNSIPAAITYLIYVIIYLQIEGNVLAPHIQSRRLDLSALAVLVSLTIGLYLFGLIGAIIAIPIAGCVRILLEEYLVKGDKKAAKPAPAK